MEHVPPPPRDERAEGEPEDPTKPADPTAEAFGDGLPPPDHPGADPEHILPLDDLVDQIQGPDLQHPQDTFEPDTLLPE